MKVYVDGQIYPSLEYETKQIKSYIYTNDGIYLYKEFKSKEKSELHKIEIEHDNEIREKEYNNYHFFIDSNSKNESNIKTNNEIIYYIPYNHLFCREEIYKKNIGDGIFLVKVNYFDQVDYYFETDRTDESLYDVIITFLSSI